MNKIFDVLCAAELIINYSNNKVIDGEWKENAHVNYCLLQTNTFVVIIHI